MTGWVSLAASAWSGPGPAVLSTNRTPVLSTSRLFHAAGGTSSENLQIATFADRVKEALVNRVGMAVPEFSRNPILLTLREMDGTSRVQRFQQYANRALQQEVLVIRPAHADQEQVLEAIIWCLLNRYGFLLQGEEERERVGVEVPEWLSMGVGQSLFHLSRVRNRQLLQPLVPVRKFHSVEDMLSWIRLPNQRPVTHAECEMLWQWLQVSDHEVLSTLIQRVAQGEELSEAWLMGVTGSLSSRDVAMNRDLWLAQKLLPHLSPRPYNVHDIGKLQTLLNLELPIFDLFFESHPVQRRTIPGLLQRLPEESAQETLAILGRELGRLNTGKLGPMSSWLASFTTLLGDATSQPVLTSDAEVKTLLLRWQELEHKRSGLMSYWLNQDRYLDQFDIPAARNSD